MLGERPIPLLLILTLILWCVLYGITCSIVIHLSNPDQLVTVNVSDDDQANIHVGIQEYHCHSLH